MVIDDLNENSAYTVRKAIARIDISIDLMNTTLSAVDDYAKIINGDVIPVKC